MVWVTVLERVSGQSLSYRLVLVPWLVLLMVQM
jgi:hypothetical protein